jgi:c-di-GMP-binding flagellar brake protein YcgR
LSLSQKESRSFVRTKKVRIIVLHSVDHPKLKKLLRKIGCSEIFKTSISAKFLQKLLEKYLGKAVSGGNDLDGMTVKSRSTSDSGDDDVQVVKSSSGPASTVLDISDEMPEADSVIQADDGDDGRDLLAKAEANIEDKITGSKISGESNTPKPQAIDFAIPDDKLDEEQQKIRSYYREIFPNEEKEANGEKKNSFGDVESKEKKASFMNESKDSGRSLTVWTHGRENLVHTKLKVIDEDNNMYAIQFDDKADGNTKLLDQIRNAAFDVLFVKLDISRGSIFFDVRDPHKELEEDYIKVSIPERMWRVDRRNYHRLTFPKKVDNQVALKVEGFRNGEEIERKIINLGAGGACIGVFPNEAKHFEEGTFIESFFLSVKGQELECCGKVVWREQFDGDAFVSIGIEFLGLGDDFIEAINLFILEETFEFWEKYHV